MEGGGEGRGGEEQVYPRSKGKNLRVFSLSASFLSFPTPVPCIIWYRTSSPIKKRCSPTLPKSLPPRSPPEVCTLANGKKSVCAILFYIFAFSPISRASYIPIVPLFDEWYVHFIRLGFQWGSLILVLSCFVILLLLVLDLPLTLIFCFSLA